MDKICREALAIWQSGGWAMIVLAANAFILFFLGLSVKIRLMGKPYRCISGNTCREGIENHRNRTGCEFLHQFIGFVMNSGSIHQMMLLFKEFRLNEIFPFARDLRIMKVCVAAAPLLGLLGTVSGMLTMFDALSVGSGGEKTLGMVAGGISEALVTTETGLIIALPGLFFLHHLQQALDRYREFLSCLETECAQSLYRIINCNI
jgi:biopolymer transport protein ExbB